MKLINLFNVTFFLLSACIYDPPRKGKNILIENQTNQFIYVTDSLGGQQGPVLYDTMIVNKEKYIQARGNYIAPFSKFNYFFSELHAATVDSKRIKELEIFIIPDKYCRMALDTIRINKFYRSVGVNYKNLSADSMYYIFVREDGIGLTSRFDLEHVK